MEINSLGPWVLLSSSAVPGILRSGEVLLNFNIYKVSLNTNYSSVCLRASQAAPAVKNPPANAGDLRDGGLIPRLGRPPGGGHGSPVLYSCLENPMDRGAWRATVRVDQQRVGHNWSDSASTDHVVVQSEIRYFFFGGGGWVKDANKRLAKILHF